MSFVQTALLGALAGFTIYLGLPVGRLQLLGSRARVAMAMFSIGVLAFIFVDVLSNGLGIVEDALHSAQHHHGSVAYLVWLVFLLAIGFAAGSAGLATIEKGIRPRRPAAPPIVGGATALSPSEADVVAAEAELRRRRALRTGLTIAGAI